MWRFTKSFFVILFSFATLVGGSLLLSSCSAEALIPSLRGNEIQFEVTENPIVPDSGATPTRATMVTSLSQIKVYAYDASGNTVINGAIYTNNNGTWTSSTSTEWPSGTVTFYAFSPANNSSVSFNTSTKQLTYTAPTAQGSQQDVCYAYTSTSRQANNTVALTFNHANAAFSVNARLASGCTATVSVSGVSIVNVKPTNTLTFNNSAVSASGSNITSALKCSTRSLTTTDQAISTEPLMLPPQTVTAWAGNNAISSQTGAYLAVNCKVAQDDKYVVGSATADGTVYVPMSKPLNRGENNSVNLVFGNEENGARCYGRDANGNRITYSTSSPSTPKIITEITTADLGKVICTDGTIYNTVAEATAAEKTAAAMIGYVSGTGHGLAIALEDFTDRELPWVEEFGEEGLEYTPNVDGYLWKLPSPNDFDHMFASFGGTAYSPEEHSVGRQSWSYGSFRNKLVACGGKDMTGGDTGSIYWSSTPCTWGSYYIHTYNFEESEWFTPDWDQSYSIRVCIEF